MAKNNKDKKKEIEIVNGDGTDLEFSPVFDHLSITKPKTKTEKEMKKKIIIPEVKKNKKV